MNARTDNGKTPLMFAADEGSAECVELLLQHGADICALDNYGNSVLYYCKYNLTYNSETYRVLVERGAEEGPGPAGVYPFNTEKQDFMANLPLSAQNI